MELEWLRGSPTQWRVFNAMCANPGGLAMQELIPLVYSDPDSEPDYAVETLHLSIMKLNRSFVARGELLYIRRCSPGRYRLFISRRPQQRSGRQYLPPKTVKQIRAAKGTPAEVAKLFATTPQNVRKIRDGKTWRHVT